MNKHFHVFRSALVFALSFCLLLLPFLNSNDWLFAQDIDIEKTIKDADQKYTEGRFDETIALLTVVVESAKVTSEQKQQAYRLMGLTYIAKDYLTEAKKSIENLLKLVPNYKPDPIYDPPPFINLVEQVQSETVAKKASLADKESDNKMWWYIGGGVAAVGILAVILASSSSDEETPTDQALPAPPALP
ncbi:MAG: hypothetical protein E4H13_09305 [Calditrichales bacterium]|nr:MAG: hypothetical protein E4H13_09305 [Calditrichales bacterium]